MRKSSPLQQTRRARTLSQRQVASVLGVSHQTYSKYESGRLIVPPHHRARLTSLFGTSEDAIFPEREREGVSA